MATSIEPDEGLLKKAMKPGGIRAGAVFTTLAEKLEAFCDRPLDSEVFVTAARFLNLCRSREIHFLPEIPGQP